MVEPGADRNVVRIERVDEDVSASEGELLELFVSAFGGADSLWPANQRWLVRHSDRLVSHAAVQRRWFIVNSRYYQGWFVGTVCTDPAFQNQGLATRVVKEMHSDLGDQDLEFAVLNCGGSLVPFYERLNYVKIADKGVYLRNGQHVVDEDAAMAHSFSQDFDIDALRCDPFPFGFDF